MSEAKKILNQISENKMKGTVYFWIAGTQHQEEVEANSRMEAFQKIRDKHPGAINISAHMNEFPANVENKKVVEGFEDGAVDPLSDLHTELKRLIGKLDQFPGEYKANPRNLKLEQEHEYLLNCLEKANKAFENLAKLFYNEDGFGDGNEYKKVSDYRKGIYY